MVEFVTGYVQVSQKMLDDAADFRKGWDAWMAMTPEERQQAMWEAEQGRAVERAGAEHRSLTLDGLLDKLGWTSAYAEHLVQPYCDCGEGMDGWDYCIHARDLGLTSG
jgi:hypothetical protein